MTAIELTKQKSPETLRPQGWLENGFEPPRPYGRTSGIIITPTAIAAATFRLMRAMAAIGGPQSFSLCALLSIEPGSRAVNRPASPGSGTV